MKVRAIVKHIDMERKCCVYIGDEYEVSQESALNRIKNGVAVSVDNLSDEQQEAKITANKPRKRRIAK